MVVTGSIIVICFVIMFVLIESRRSNVNAYISSYMILLFTSYCLRAFFSVFLQGSVNTDFSAPEINIDSPWGFTTEFVHAINGHLALLLGTNTVPFSLLYSLFGLIGSCYLLRCLLLTSPEFLVSRLSVILLFFLPGMLCFTSILGKDAIIFMCANSCLYYVIKKSLSFMDCVILLLMFSVMIVIRPYFLAIILISLCLYTFISTSSMRSKIFMMILISVTFILTKKIFLNNYGISADFSAQSLANIGGTHQVGMSSGSALVVVNSSMRGYFFNFPYMIFGNLFLPLYSIHGLSLIVASMENVFILSFFIYYLMKRYLFNRIYLNDIYNQRAVSIILSYSAAGILVLAANNSNLGYAIRVKYLYILPLYVYISGAIHASVIMRKSNKLITAPTL